MTRATAGEPLINMAANFVLDGEQSHGVRTHSVGVEWAAVLALRSASLAEYVCKMSLTLADCKREQAEGLAVEAERRRPSGRRVHTIARSQELRNEAARHVEAADAAEFVALSAIGKSDIAAAHRAVAHLNSTLDRSRSDSELEWSYALDVAKKVRTLERKRRRWSYVRGRAELASQPPGGVLPLSYFSSYQLGGVTLTRRTESGPPGTISSAVEFIARWDLEGDPRADADLSVAALEAIRGVRRGEHTEASPGLVAAMLRGSEWNDDEYDELKWEEGEGDETLAHIAEMRARVSRFFERFGRPVRTGTWAVNSKRFHLDGHIDFVTTDSIWDLKVSEKVPDRLDVLQLLLYWVAFREDPANDDGIAYLGIYNPRLDRAWRIAVAEIPRDVAIWVESLALSEYPAAIL